MHEASIAQDIIDIVNDVMTGYPDKKVKQVNVIIGEMVAVVPESLQFSYQAISAESPLQDSILNIEIVPILARCRSCDKEFDISAFEFYCPFCQSLSIEILKGNEFYIKDVEISE